MLYGHDCSDCVELSQVHRTINWVHTACVISFIVVMAAVFFVVSGGAVDFVVFGSVGILVCFLCKIVIHYTHCSRFFIAMDNVGRLHVHKKNRPPLDAQIIIDVKAGKWRRRCQVHGNVLHTWSIKANNEFLFLTDIGGDITSVRYCLKRSRVDPPGYTSLITNELPRTLQLVSTSGSVANIHRWALDHINAETQEVPAVAGSISANQG